MNNSNYLEKIYDNAIKVIENIDLNCSYNFDKNKINNLLSNYSGLDREFLSIIIDNTKYVNINSILKK